MSTMARWRRRMGVVALLTVVACWSPGGSLANQYLLVEDFSASCGALPCGWEQVAGPASRARLASRVHPGLRGIELSGADVIVRGPGSAPGNARLNFGALEAKLAARCDAGNALTVRLAVAAGAGDSGPGRAYDTFSGRGTPAEGSLLITMTASTALVPGSPFAGGGPFSTSIYEILAVTIAKSGSGRCTIDTMMIGDVGSSVVPLDPGCG